MKALYFYEPYEQLGFLSNFFPCRILFDGKLWKSTEHIYQASKFNDPKVQEDVRQIELPRDAFLFSRENQKHIRVDWEAVKLEMMFNILMEKFIQNNHLREELLFCNGYFVENSQKDYFWGIGEDGNGENNLGKLLSKVKEAILSFTKEVGEFAHTIIPVKEKLHSIFAFRDVYEHFIYYNYIRSFENKPSTVRIHSECVTGDLLGSDKCDCGEQLNLALNEFNSDKPMLLTYLRQEGRGIGLVNKIRAYENQWNGADTIDANIKIGLPEDCRNYKNAILAMKFLGVKQAYLMTNNPKKIEAFNDSSIEILKRIEMKPKLNKSNREYINTKIKRMGHLINEA
jgi:GTP cyclohydrolase II